MSLTSYSLLALGYVLGSIPFGLIVGKFAKVDLRKSGSGNIGATNMFRQGGWKLGLTVLLLDGLKAAIPTYLATQYLSLPWQHILVGLMAIIGHTYPLFAKFKGGRGAAPGLGVLLALSPLVFLILLTIAFSLIFLLRIVSIATLTCCLLAPGLFYGFKQPIDYTIFVTVICCLIIFRHKDNISRLIKGSENKI